MLRVPMLPAAAAMARPSRRPILKTAAALFRQGTDTLLYGFLAVAWAHSLCGVAFKILARWVCGKDSAAEAIGSTVRAACWVVMVWLFPAIVPLVLMRINEFAKHVTEEERKRERERERRQELASSERLPKRNGVLHLLPEGFNLAPLYMTPPLYQLLHLAILMQHAEGEGFVMWRVGSVLRDVACFGIAVSTGFWLQNIMLILVTVSRVKKGVYVVRP